MKYISTRGKSPALDFNEILLAGLAPDGGLYVPEEIPKFSEAEIKDMSSLSYSELAFLLIKPFVGGVIDDSELRTMIFQAYSVYTHKDVAPLVQLSENHWILELFHGPTLAFKDFALQLLGILVEHVLAKTGRRALVLGATSGDTGSAAISGCSRVPSIPIFILYPHERISEFQRRQMTTIRSENVHIGAVEGSFDDCQNLVKSCFRDQNFIRGEYNLVAVNSINWARIIAQVVYYFYAALKIGAPGKSIAFSVPTGNFGDIFAGYIASKMGLPVERLIIATNENDVLHRVMQSGEYKKTFLKKTHSPSMDISVSSNFERLLFDLYARDGILIDGMMDNFDGQGINLSSSALNHLRSLFSSQRVDEKETLEQISDSWRNNRYLLDPHSAVGVRAAIKSNFSSNIPVVSLATAHPAKFTEAIIAAGVDCEVHVPEHVSNIFELDEKYEILPNDLNEIQSQMNRFFSNKDIV